MRHYLTAMFLVIATALCYSCSTGTANAEVSPVLENEWLYFGNGPHVLRVAASLPEKSEQAKVRIPIAIVLKTDMKEPVGEYTQKASPTIGNPDTLSFELPLVPGFYIVELYASDSLVRTFNIGCEPERIVSPQDKAEDFDEFWNNNLKELAKVAPRYRLTLLPEHSNKIRRTYKVEMKSFGGETISGLYVEPVKAGKYPAFITYMGYNASLWYPDPSSKPETVEFILSHRKQGLNKAQDDPAHWVTEGLESKDSYYYKGAFMDVIRAIDFVESRKKVDADKIFAEGGSQGGALTLVAASLDRRIKGIAPFVPFLSDYKDYFKIAEWPGNEILPAADSLGISDEDLYHTLSYFDVKNFVDKIQCPVLMGFGLQDPVCPPHTNFAGYNLISTEKNYVCFPEAQHQVEREDGWWKARDEFFGNLLTNKL